MDRTTLSSVIRAIRIVLNRAGITYALPGSLVALMAVPLAGYGQSSSADPSLPSSLASVTFNKDIAPIVFDHCSSCHRPGELAPFSLLTYEDVKSRAALIATATENRIMPPWLPEPGYGEFLGNRSLMDEEIALIQRWVEEGAAEGDPSDRPPAPQRSEGWQLGEPDVVIQMQEPYTLRADAGEVFRNFVMSTPVQSPQYVRAVELRPGNTRVVHHAQMLIDETASSRELDRDDLEPGYDGMFTTSQAHSPSGFFLGWTPGKVPFGGVEGMSWRLEQPGTDLVLESHLRPTGQPEVIDATVGLYLTDQPPVRSSFLLRLGSAEIDISAGNRDYTIQDTYVLPVDVEVYSVYPHAHYLAKEMLGYGTLPDGTTEWLIRINEWDFNWQDEYRLAEPMFLPKGTTLTMRYTYDNSADNVRNPNRPPQHVVYGPKSSDEMGDLWIQVFLWNDSDQAVLDNDFRLKDLRLKIAGYQQMLRINPDSAAAHFNLGAAYQSLGRWEEALTHYEQALRVDPDDSGVHNNLASVLQTMGRFDQAMSHYGEALRVNPDNAEAHNNLGTVLAARGELSEAITHYREALRVNADFADAHFNLGNGLAVQGRLDEAINQYSQALRLDPDRPQAHSNLGSALQSQGRLDEAIGHYRQAVQLSGNLAGAHYNLGSALQAQGELDEAIGHYRQALQLNGNLAAGHNALGTALAEQGELDEAVSHYLRALELEPDDAGTRYNLAVAIRITARDSLDTGHPPGCGGPRPGCGDPARRASGGADRVSGSRGQATDIALFMDLLRGDQEQAVEAERVILEEWDDSYAVMLIELWFLAETVDQFRLLSLLERGTGQSFREDMNQWWDWIWSTNPGTHPDYAAFKAILYALIDPSFNDYFDDDTGAKIRLDEIRWGGVVRDGIPPLNLPAFTDARGARYLDDDNIVFGISINGEERVYPKRILAWHEMFKDTIGGEHFTGVYCTLCGSMILYRSTIDGEHHELGTSGFLYRSNKLMYDDATRSLWSTLTGGPVLGPLAARDIELEPLFVVTTTWGEWRRRHPRTLVLSIDTGYERDYSEGRAYRDYFATDDLMFPVPELDTRLKNKDEVLALRFPGVSAEQLAISVEFLARQPTYHDSLGDVALVVLTDPSGASRVYETRGRHFSRWDGQDGVWDDDGERWTLEEEALTSPDGTSLRRLPSHRAFWFGWYAQFPDTRLVR